MPLTIRLLTMVGTRQKKKNQYLTDIKLEGFFQEFLFGYREQRYSFTFTFLSLTSAKEENNSMNSSVHYSLCVCVFMAPSRWGKNKKSWYGCQSIMHVLALKPDATLYCVRQMNKRKIDES
ncbi:CLUMA_CG014690, isoform A [Clunio marinus]|uniref:CLUMA_CG014690, isoform A n=1 Tax=Clunio marinus TaxID=568069 RepID=A0A1J1IRW6_9DIPT|nr:CLUMA_CG014690, isoform A [Clunio marinus]